MMFLVSCQNNVTEDEVGSTTSARDHEFDQDAFDRAVEEQVRLKLTRTGQENLVELTQELIQKENQIGLSKLELKKKSEELESSIRDFEKRVADFRTEQERFIGCVEDKEQEVSNRVGHMVNVVSGMRPQNAAEVLSVQDADIAVQILERLNPDNVARIFNQMDKEVSARLQKQFLNMQK